VKKLAQKHGWICTNRCKGGDVIKSCAFQQKLLPETNSVVISNHWIGPFIRFRIFYFLKIWGLVPCSLDIYASYEAGIYYQHMFYLIQNYCYQGTWYILGTGFMCAHPVWCYKELRVFVACKHKLFLHLSQYVNNRASLELLNSFFMAL